MELTVHNSILWLVISRIEFRDIFLVLSRERLGKLDNWRMSLLPLLYKESIMKKQLIIYVVACIKQSR